MGAFSLIVVINLLNSCNGNLNQKYYGFQDR